MLGILGTYINQKNTKAFKSIVDQCSELGLGYLKVVADCPPVEVEHAHQWARQFPEEQRLHILEILHKAECEQLGPEETWSNLVSLHLDHTLSKSPLLNEVQ